MGLVVRRCFQCSAGKSLNASSVSQHCFSTPFENTSFRAPVDLAKLRWRMERDYQELKQEVGSGIMRARRRGFHHHATLCVPPTVS